VSTRKAFLTAAASGALLAAAPAPPPPPAATATPSPPAAAKTSPLSRAFAERMRAFDPALTDAQIETIAEGIEDNLKTGSRVNPKGKALSNSDEPATIFEVEG